MIIYYNKNTGKIYGAILGRIHTEEELRPNLIQPRNVDPKEVKRHVFDLEATKKIEKYLEGEQIKILHCEVVTEDDDTIHLKKKSPEPKPQPDSVETIVIDLKKPLKDIEKDFSDNTKRNLKKVEEMYMTFREVPFSDMGKVRDVIGELEDMKDIKLAKHILTVRAAFLDGVRRAYVVEDKNEDPLAVAVITVKAGRFIYTLGGVTKKGRDTNAGDFLVYNLIKDAKDLGFELYDVGGIYADWASDEKKKVNKFKQRWGGKVSPLI